MRGLFAKKRLRSRRYPDGHVPSNATPVPSVVTLEIGEMMTDVTGRIGKSAADPGQLRGNVPNAGPARQIIRREGEYWTLVFAGETCRLKDTVGLRYLDVLLRHPHDIIAATSIIRCGREEIGGLRDEADPMVHERARVNVTRALSAVVKRLQTHHPALARHLQATLRTGKLCSYTPDPRLSMKWTTHAE
jgi:hypothetical protein